MDFTHLLAFEEVPNLQNVVLWPGLLLLAGALIWWFGWKYEKDDGNPKIKWAAMLPLLIAVFLSYETFMLMINTGVDGEAYRAQFDNSRKIVYAGYFAFLAPTLAILTFIAWSVIDNKMGKYR